ncbi:hypothetical protein CAPTEDRAFT_228672 [Capitella teleta]|uniref:Alpha-galactosidase n=1 Tax=Capitella teleta TaxID=283909 RepID=R7VI12_CAPTE|nr:hypothetical protein CAPTEDRAFT_228672 [Capitella teleta]|eukprot:ELU18239.1 hypothetical protein CAPTEDRAFT_228672 [Capitella teleta]
MCNDVKMRWNVLGVQVHALASLLPAAVGTMELSYAQLKCATNYDDICNFNGSEPNWLIEDVAWSTTLKTQPNGNLVLSNGLISREFSLNPAFVTIDYISHEKDLSLLRALGPEASIYLDGVLYNIGGLITSAPRAYLNRTAIEEDATADPGAFQYAAHVVVEPEAPYKYTPGQRGSPNDSVWPPKGKRLDITFKAPAVAPEQHKKVEVVLHYEMYDGIPLMAKWMTVTAEEQAQDVQLMISTVEYLAVNWEWASEQISPATGHWIGTRSKVGVAGYGWLVAETTEAYNGMANWERDKSRLEMPGSLQATLNATYEHPVITPIGASGITSFRITELVVGSDDKERRGLARRKKMRLLAPQTQENPLYFHSKNQSLATMYSLVDQLSEVGFEMLVFSFGSGFDYETDNQTYLDDIKKLVAYGTSKGLEMGGYDLISLSRYLPWPYWRDVPPPGHKGSGACFASGWYDYLMKRLIHFMDYTGMTVIITDGPYGGYPCYSTNHTYHHGYEDSIYRQIENQNKFFKYFTERGTYVTTPDSYFYHGANRARKYYVTCNFVVYKMSIAAMGYDEFQYSLPRWQDLAITRTQIYDHSFFYIPSRGYVMVPMLEYHGAPHPERAVFQPVSQHKTEFEWVLAQYLGAGVGIHFRGDQLFDDDATKMLVMKWVAFYKEHRDILNSDIIHIIRPNMQSLDAFMHVNPRLPTKALVMVFNPTERAIGKKISLPLYYTGLTNEAVVAEQDGLKKVYTLDRGYGVDVHVELRPLCVTWLTVYAPTRDSPDAYMNTHENKNEL